MCKISVIIPMYNAEPFITQCLQSVIRQTYRNLEILVIDDGSTDRGAEVCRKLCMTDNRIQVYSQKNGGVSRARNYGLDIATGEYIFFLDSDDAIHPLLLEEMMGQVQMRRAEMVFCDNARMSSAEIEHRINIVSPEDNRPEWEIAEGPQVEEWFHITYYKELAGISGMISRACIGDLRFDESLSIGEDTLFMYRLFCKQVRTAYSSCAWYYYRMHQESASHTAKKRLQDRYFDCNITIRDNECKRGNYKYALRREEAIALQMRETYGRFRKLKDKDSCKKLREIAANEKRNSLFKSLVLSRRILFACCFICYPFYLLLNKMDIMAWEWKEAVRNGRK